MGGWALEVFKMAMYVSFPVGLFHYFNSPGNIEEDLVKTRQDYLDKFMGVERFEQRRKELEEKKERQLEARDRRRDD